VILQGCVLACNFVGEQKRILDHAGKRSQPEVYRANLDAATLRFFHNSVHYAHRNREFAHALAVPILYSIAEALAGRGVWTRVLKE
jgi:hypothetical protein